jgi:hypothetical protein
MSIAGIEGKSPMCSSEVMASMEVKEQPKRRQSVKESIQYVCSLITDLGISGLSAEVMRLAKFNKLSSCNCLLRTLHDLVALHLSCSFCLPPHAHVVKNTTPEQSTKLTAGFHEFSKECRSLEENFLPGAKLKSLRTALGSMSLKQTSNGEAAADGDLVHLQAGDSKELNGRSSTIAPNLLIRNRLRKKSSAVAVFRKEAGLDLGMIHICHQQVDHDMKQQERQWQKELTAALDSVCREYGEEGMLGFVKFYLALWGYPAHSPFFSLDEINNNSSASRHLLLALGWLISHCNVIQHGLEHRIQPFLAVKASAPLPNEYPPDTTTSSEALQKGKEAENVIQAHMQRVIARSNKVTQPSKRTEVRAEQLLMLYGQVHFHVDFATLPILIINLFAKCFSLQFKLFFGGLT